MKPKKILSGLIISMGLFFTGCQNGENPSTKELSKFEHHEEEEEEKYEGPSENWKLQDYKTLKAKQKRLLEDFDAPAQEAPTDSIISSDDGLARMANEGGVFGEWNEVGSINMAGRVSWSFYYEPNNSVYALASGQIWKGAIDGSSWVCINDQMKFQKAMTVHVMKTLEGKDRIIVTDMEGVYYSDNEGQSWNLAEHPDLGRYGLLVHTVITNDNVIYILAKDYLWVNGIGGNGIALLKSTDQGQTFEKLWRLAGYDNDRSDLFYDNYSDDENLYVIFYNEFYAHNTSNDELTLLSTIDLTEHDVLERGVRRVFMTKDENDVYIDLYPENDEPEGGKLSYMFTSRDNGQTFNFMGKVNDAPFAKHSLTALKGRPGEVVMGEVQMRKTFDFGETWGIFHDLNGYRNNVETVMHADFPDIKLAQKNGEYFYLISTDGGLYISYDDLNTVRNISMEGLNISQYYGLYTNREHSNIIFGGSQDQGLQRTFGANGEPAAFENLHGGDGGYLVSNDGGKSVWMTWQRGIRFISNAEEQKENLIWSDSWDVGYLGGHFLPTIREHPYEAQTVLTGTGVLDGKVHIYKGTVQLPESKEIVKTVLSDVNGNPHDFADGDDRAKISGIYYSPVNKDHWYVNKTDGTFFYSRDAGLSWEKSQDSTVRNQGFSMTAMAPHATDVNTVFIGGDGYKGHPVKVSRNGGVTFESFSNGLPDTYVYSLAMSADGGYLFAATAVGAYVLPLNGDEWFDLGGPEQSYRFAEWIESTNSIRFGTYGRGIWDFSLSDIPTHAEYYHIVHKGTNKRFQTCSTEEGSWVGAKDSSATWHCTQWKLVSNGDYFHIQNRNSGMYVRPINDKNGSNIEQRPTSWNGDWTQWSYKNTYDGYGHLVNKATGKYVSVEGSYIKLQPSSWTGDWTRYKFVPVVD